MGIKPTPIGARFNRLTVLSRAGASHANKAIWTCRCDCGVVKEYDAFNVKSGHTLSCGCRSLERARVHGATVNLRHGYCPKGPASPTYRSWQSMLQRCGNPKMIHYRNYGGRGITVCAAWQDFTGFLRDMGERPLGRTLDRINNDLGYFKANCRWATPKQQAANRRVMHRPSTGVLFDASA